ncbi:hypothetical protein GCM10025857_31570 [Alicyclobacillus contaminans]|nr:hypothetical protein [Alicyclobacillus contaminans]GMA51800.1 hypothetical protein GCM10025857_31570 [Alicyclobacillus contaminans]
MEKTFVPRVEYDTYVDKYGKVWEIEYEEGEEDLMDIIVRILPTLLSN